MKKEDRDIALNPTQFRKVGSAGFIDLRTLDETDEEVYNSIYYKEVPVVTGDMDETIRLLSGYERSELTVMYTSFADIDRYALVWACMGETGEQIGKAVILDDGNYHYALTVLADADRTAEYIQTWDQLFASFTLS